MEEKIDLIAQLLLYNRKVDVETANLERRQYQNYSNKRTGVDELEFELEKDLLRLVSERCDVEEKLKALVGG